MRLFKRIVVFILLLTVAIFAAMNPASVDLDLLLVQVKAPLGVAMIGGFLVGMLCGALLILLRRPLKSSARVSREGAGAKPV